MEKLTLTTVKKEVAKMIKTSDPHFIAGLDLDFIESIANGLYTSLEEVQEIAEAIIKAETIAYELGNETFF